MKSFQTKYEIVSKLGEGTFSDVIKCVQKTTGEFVAAKRLKKLYTSEESIYNCSEIIAWAKIPPHKNILNMMEYYYDFFTGQVVFIFEIMDMSMYEYISKKRKPFSEFKVKGYLYQLLNGVDHMHQCGFFHRDIKPENILLKLYPKNELIKVGDFGSMRGIYSARPYTEYVSTRWYRSPECLLTIGNYSFKMDIWAIGCVFYEMLMLKPLFTGTNEIDQLSKIHKILGAPSKSLLQKLHPKSNNCIEFPKIKGIGIHYLLPQLSNEGKEVLKLMLEYDPQKRTNTKRILQHFYFNKFRSIPVIQQSKEINREKLFAKCSGDTNEPCRFHKMVSVRPSSLEKYCDLKVLQPSKRKGVNMVNQCNRRNNQLVTDTRQRSVEFDNMNCRMFVSLNNNTGYNFVNGKFCDKFHNQYNYRRSSDPIHKPPEKNTKKMFSTR